MFCNIYILAHSGKKIKHFQTHFRLVYYFLLKILKYAFFLSFLLDNRKTHDMMVSES